MRQKEHHIILTLFALHCFQLLPFQRCLDLIQTDLDRLQLCDQMNRLRRFRQNILYAISYLIQISRHLRQCNVEKQRKKQKESHDQKEDLVIPNQSPI